MLNTLYNNYITLFSGKLNNVNILINCKYNIIKSVFCKIKTTILLYNTDVVKSTGIQ